MSIKGIHSIVTDAISQLDYGPVTNDRPTWMTFVQCWCYHKTAQPEAFLATTRESMNQVFANQNEEDSIYPLTTREIGETKQEDGSLLKQRLFNSLSCHPGTKHLKKTLCLLMY
eukprot:CCRYP_017132-RA/>CCRYP_017132-RA protein AED:0.42 eAED:0.91 QI:0/0/0/1/0/0/2/0/113